MNDKETLKLLATIKGIVDGIIPYDKRLTNQEKLDLIWGYASVEKIGESLKTIDEILEKTRSILQECDKDPDKNDLAIKYLLNQKQLLNKLKETLS